MTTSEWSPSTQDAIRSVGLATDVALDVTNTIFEVTGARATSNAVGLDRFWRNVRTHTLHDPVAYKRREVGDHFLTERTHLSRCTRDLMR